MSACLKYTRSFIWLLIASLCSGTLFYFIYRSAINVPFIDDYCALIDFIIQYSKAESIQQKIHFIFRQHNVHRIAFARLIVLLDHYATNSINFRHLALLGSINQIVIAGIFSFEAYKIRKDIVAIVPVIFLTFNFQHINNLLWATSSLQNVGIIALACVAIWLLTRESTYLQLAGLVFAFLATFSSGSGPAIWLIILLLAILKGNTVKCIIVLLTGIGSLFLYFNQYQVTLNSNTDLVEKLFNILTVVTGVIGGSFDIQEKENYFWPVLAGFLIIMTFSYYLWKIGLNTIREDSSILFLLGVFAFGFLSALTIGIGRSSFIENRYKIISMLCILATYTISLACSSYKKDPVPINFINAACLSLWLLFFWGYYPEMLAYKYDRKAEYLSIINNPAKAQSPFQYRFDHLDELGINSLDDSLTQKRFIASALQKNFRLDQLRILEAENKYRVVWKDSSNEDYESYLILKSEDGSAAFPVRNVTNDIATFVKNKGEFYSGIKEVNILFDWVPKGEYNTFIYFPDKNALVPIQDHIVISRNVQPWLSFRWFGDKNAL